MNDEGQVAAAGVMTKVLTQPSIERHLGDSGVDPESVPHTLINHWSGGSEVVAAGARPHPRWPSPCLWPSKTTTVTC